MNVFSAFFIVLGLALAFSLFLIWATVRIYNNALDMLVQSRRYPNKDEATEMAMGLTCLVWAMISILIGLLGAASL